MDNEEEKEGSEEKGKTIEVAALRELFGNEIAMKEMREALFGKRSQPTSTILYRV